MQLIIDENIPFAEAFFSSVTPDPLVKVPGRHLARHVDSALLTDARALIIRSVTRVDRDLLEKCPNLSFVGTCTIGTDHIDSEACAERGIKVVSAPGCNANSVVEYVFSALAALNIDWRQKTVGIVGCGNVGGALFRRLVDLGVACKVYDPLFDVGLFDPAYREQLSALRVNRLEDLLGADIVSLHTPLTTSGPYPSKHLLGYRELKLLRPGAVLLNAGRGPVIDNQALFQIVQERADLQVVLDVWEREPEVPLALMDSIAIASPHIAGYSFDGKAAGTAMIYKRFCEHFQRPVTTLLESVLPEYKGPELTLPNASEIDCLSDSDLINHIVLQAYNVLDDDLLMRDTLKDAAARSAEVASAFDQLRKNYPVRREFGSFKFSVDLANQVYTRQLQSVFLSLGFFL